MAITAADWTVTRSTGDIRYIGNDHGGGSPSYATVIEFHRWLQDLADDAVSSGDDELDITDQDPSARSTDNIITLKGTYNIDDTAAEHLYDGSIIQGTGGTEVYYDGIINFGNSDVQIQIIQDGAVLADDWWNFSGGGLNPDSAQGISHRFMIKVRDAGADIDGRRLISTTRVFGKTYSEFSINGTSRGNNVLALSNTDDLNNATIEGTVSGWTGISNTTEGYVGLDVDNNGADEFYYSEWNANTPTRTINEYYERMKWLTRDASAESLYGLSGELFRGITHEIPYTTLSGTFDEANSISWTGTNAGTGQVLADNGVDTVWIQILTGVAPANGDSLSQSSPDAASATAGTFVERAISTPFVGQSTGSAIIGSYGLGIETNDLLVTDKVFDLTDTQVSPPNNVTFGVAGLVSGEDYVLVAPWDGVSTDNNGDPAIETDQLSLNTSLTIDNVTSVVVSTAIPSDTPSTGTIRVVDDAGFARRLEFSSWTGSTFTISSTDGQEDFLGDEATSGNDVYISYIDVLADAAVESYTAVYSADRDLVVFVRDGGTVNSTPIKQFVTSATFSGSNTTITAIRTTDL